MEIKRGEIYYVNKMPVVGAEHEAGRPAVVVSTDRHNAKSGTIEVVYLTTRAKGMMPEHTLRRRHHVLLRRAVWPC